MGTNYYSLFTIIIYHYYLPLLSTIIYSLLGGILNLI